MDLGFERAGFDPRLAIDLSPDAVTTYRHNHACAHVEQRDLAATSTSEIVSLWNRASPTPPVGVIGGPPCQAFSRGNARAKPDDPRRELPVRFAELLRELHDEYALSFFVFENVAGLRSERHSDPYKRFWLKCLEAGFRLHEALLDAQDFGVPQRRKRLFVVGLSAGFVTTNDSPFPDPSIFQRLRTVRDVIEGLPEPVYYERGLLPHTIPLHPNHWTMKPKSRRFDSPITDSVKREAQSFRLLAWDEPSPTVAYGNREIHIHPCGHRRLSIFEGMRLQGFPDSYQLLGSLSAQVRMLGDAVPPPLAEAIARSVRDVLLKQTAQESASA